MTTIDQELLWEREMIDSGVLRYYKGIERTKSKINVHGKKVDLLDESNTSYGISMLRYFVLDIAKQITADCKRLLGKPGRKPTAWYYLNELEAETVAFITCKCILDSISKTVKLTQVAMRIAGKLEDNTRFETFEKYDKKYIKSTLRTLKQNKVTGYRAKRKILVKTVKVRENGVLDWEHWPTKDKLHIGIACIEAFIKATSDYNDNGVRIEKSGLVELKKQYSFKKTTYYMYGTPKAYEWIKANTDVCQYLTPDFMPLLVKPLDWKTPYDGGFHTKQLRRVKPLVKMQRPKYLKSMAENIDNMPLFVRTANILQGTAWEVNSFVLKQACIEFMLPRGIDMPGTEPTALPECPLEPFEQGNMTNAEFKQYKVDKRKALTEEDKVKFIAWKRVCDQIEKGEIERVSKAMGVSRTINMAKRLQFQEEIFFVWTADFRGRFYSCGTALSPQGTGLSKALIKFKKGVRLGKKGFEHLCIYAAGLYGQDKVSLPDRVAWVLQRKDEIIKSGTDPDSIREFWGQADKPYLFIAVCEELAECIQLSTKEQEDFISHIPCAQDGSCNGIQHYSALLRDPVGAKSVNLQDSEVPNDIYIDCADEVIRMLKKGLTEGIVFDGYTWLRAGPIDKAVYEGWLDFSITRDATKKPTMVIPYGGTKMACRDECMNYLERATAKKVQADSTYRNPFKNMVYMDEFNHSINMQKYAITRLHHLVWRALDIVVVAARVAMKFLKDCTKAVASSTRQGRMMQWTTGTGFTVYQDVKNTLENRIDTYLEGRIQLNLTTETDSIDKYRMQSSIAPNFVHSLDSTHMQMTVNTCYDQGIRNFSVVHDSFAVPAGECDVLHSGIRDSFINLHAGNALVSFWVDLAKKNPDLLDRLPNPKDVKQGTFDLEKVRKARHFFR